MTELVLSLFPGIDLFGLGFERAGYCVVRGPDLIFGQDIATFNAVPGKFDGVIGGPPCQDFSRARRSPPTGYGTHMLDEFRRVVLQASPTWWLMENVPGVPDLVVSGYAVQRLDLNAAECGLPQSRLRHFQFGHRLGRVISPIRQRSLNHLQPCCVASEFNKPSRRTWADFCALQGLPSDFSLPDFTQSARYRAVGNGVPVDMAETLARAVSTSLDPSDARLCACDCGRLVYGNAQSATPACRKRMQRRKAVTD